MDERKGRKRKLAEAELDTLAVTDDSCSHLPNEIAVLVSKLDSAAGSWREVDRVAASRAAHSLAQFAKHEEHVDLIVNGAAIPALVQHLKAPQVNEGEGPIACEHQVEDCAVLALGYLAVKPEHQRLIADAGALPHLVSLLKRRGNGLDDCAVNSVLIRTAYAISFFAHENDSIKSSIRTEGGIPPLVELLESSDAEVRRAAAGALYTLVAENELNKNQIVECNALSTLIFMLRFENVGIHREAVGVIANLVYLSNNRKKEVLAAGALQPVIGLLSSTCQESQKQAALLLGQFATTDPECKRGAVGPLIKMLQSPDPQLKEMAAFALGSLAQNSHYQAGIVHEGGLTPLLAVLDSKNGSLQHNAACVLYGLAENEDNISDIIKEGGVQKLQDVELLVQRSKDRVAETLKRLEEKIKDKSLQVMKHLLYLMRVSDKIIQRRVALSLSHLSSIEDQRIIFVDNKGLDILLGLLDPSTSISDQRYGAVALHTLAKRATADSPIDAALPPPTPQVYLGEQSVNNKAQSDVTFLVEGRRFYAHRIALLASSDVFRPMFDGGYRESNANDIEIPNISWEAFELMMRFIYTGTVEVPSYIAQELLGAANQYLLEGLKRLCGQRIVQDLTVETLSTVLDLYKPFGVPTLGHMCALYFLEHHDEITNEPGFPPLVQRIVPVIRDYLTLILRPPPAPSSQG